LEPGLRSEFAAATSAVISQFDISCSISRHHRSKRLKATFRPEFSQSHPLADTTSQVLDPTGID
jgi:hypothetical protein